MHAGQTADQHGTCGPHLVDLDVGWVNLGAGNNMVMIDWSKVILPFSHPVGCSLGCRLVRLAALFSPHQAQGTQEGTKCFCPRVERSG